MKIPKETLYREFTFSRQAVDEATRSVEVSFSSETDTVMRYGEPEILDHSGANLTRLNSMGVVLFNHDRDKVIGRIENARIENKRGLATIVFDDDEEAEKIYRKVLSGTLKGVSLSYTYDEYTFLGANETSTDGRFKGPCLLVRQWTGLEISVVSVPADATVGIGRSLADHVAILVAENMERMKEKPRSSEDLEADKFWINSLI